VTFDIDSNGIVHVSARDLGTGKEQKIRIESSSGLNEQQIKSMVDEAAAHEEEDRTAKENATARNQAEALMYSVERSLEEYKDKLEASDIDQIRSKSAALKKALEGKDVTEIKAKMEELNKASHKISEILYKHAQASGAAAGPEAQAGPGPQPQAKPAGEEENIVDAEFEVEDEKKR